MPGVSKTCVATPRSDDSDGARFLAATLLMARTRSRSVKLLTPFGHCNVVESKLREIRITSLTVTSRKIGTMRRLPRRKRERERETCIRPCIRYPASLEHGVCTCLCTYYLIYLFSYSLDKRGGGGSFFYPPFLFVSSFVDLFRCGKSA